jgi:hypothetical protein
MGQPQPQCESCCENTDILCVSIPGGVHIVLLGIHIDLEDLCLRISNPGPGPLTAAQQANVAQVAGAVGNLLGNLLPRDHLLSREQVSVATRDRPRSTVMVARASARRRRFSL